MGNFRFRELKQLAQAMLSLSNGETMQPHTQNVKATILPLHYDCLSRKTSKALLKTSADGCSGCTCPRGNCSDLAHVPQVCHGLNPQGCSHLDTVTFPWAHHMLMGLRHPIPVCANQNVHYQNKHYFMTLVRVWSWWLIFMSLKGNYHCIYW